MITYLVSSDCVSALLEPGETPDVRALVSLCLAGGGFAPWPDLEAELFSGSGGTLLIARPVPPLRQRPGSGAPRLRRR